MSQMNIPANVAVIWGPPLLVAGEEPGAYQELVQAVIDEYQPDTTQQWIQVGRVANSYWLVRRYEFFEPVLINRCIAHGIADEITANLPANVFMESTKVFESPYKMPSHMIKKLVEHVDDAPSHREDAERWRRAAFRAVAGDREATKAIDAAIGPGRVGMGPEWHYSSVIHDLLLLRRLKDAAEACLARNLAELERLKKRPPQRNLVRLTADNPGETPDGAANGSISVRVPHETPSSDRSK